MGIKTKTTITRLKVTKASLTGHDIVNLMRKAGIFDGEAKSFHVAMDGIELEDRSPVVVEIVHEHSEDLSEEVSFDLGCFY